jgi:hypothetical protein
VNEITNSGEIWPSRNQGFEQPKYGHGDQSYCNKPSALVLQVVFSWGYGDGDDDDQCHVRDGHSLTCCIPESHHYMLSFTYVGFPKMGIPFMVYSGKSYKQLI